jgi:probable rRNA maturation factor
MTRKKSPVIRISSTQKALRVPRKQITELIPFVAQQEGVTLAEVDVAVVDESEMAGLNRRYLSHAGLTDVLSFDLSDSQTGCGLSLQIIVCGEVAVRQGRAHGPSPRQELMLYVVHGLLHQMGYDDSSIRGAARMHAREDEILSAFRSRLAR